MNRAKKIFLLLLITLFLAVGLVFSRSAEKKEKKPPPGPPPAGVEVVRVEKRAVQSVIELVGSVESPRISLVGSEVQGLVRDISVEEGDTVKRGDLLVALEDSQLGILLEEAKEKVVESEALWKTATSQLKRNKELFQKKVISEKIHTDSRLAEEAAKSTYEQNKIKVKLLEDRMKKKKILSPFAGVVIEKFIEQGEWIVKGQNVVKLVQIDPLRIEVQLPEKVIPEIKIGDPASVRFDVLSHGETKGKVSSILPFADTASRTYPVRIELRNPERRFKVGMVARVSLSYGKKETGLLVPQDSLTLSGNSKVIMVITKENTARMVPVTVGRNINGRIEVKGDVKENDLVVVRGNERLRPGQPVTILNPKEKG